MTTPGQPPPAADRCPKCGTTVRPVDWFCPNPACGYPQFWQPGEHPDETLVGTMRRPDEGAAVTDPAPPSDTPAAAPDPEPRKPVAATTVTCWNCQTVNSEARIRCRHCGRRLHRTPAAAILAALRPPRDYRSRVIAAGGLLLALVLLISAVLLTNRDAPPPRTTSRSSVPPSPGSNSNATLPVAAASASSVWSQETGHPAAAILDDDPESAWISGRGRPIGESVTLRLARNAMVTEIRIANGYQKPGQFAANGRAARILISFDDGSAKEATLQDRQGLQTFSLADQVSPPRSATRSVLIQVLSVRPPRAANVAISTVILRGRPA